MAKPGNFLLLVILKISKENDIYVFDPPEKILASLFIWNGNNFVISNKDWISTVDNYIYFCSLIWNLMQLNFKDAIANFLASGELLSFQNETKC